MGELINKHTIKIQFATAIFVVLAVVSWTAYGVRYMAKVDEQATTISSIMPKIEKIPVLETNIDTIKGDIKEIKQDIKILLKQ